MNEPRPYRGERDLEAMRDLLVRGRQASNGTYYIHTGDLNWWLYYPPLEEDFWDHIHLWDDPENPGRLLGWALISPDWVGFDVYVQPEHRGSLIATEMYVWYGTNEYNFEKLPNPPAFEPTKCSKCGVVIHLGTDGYTQRGDEYWCEECAEKKREKDMAAPDRRSSFQNGDRYA